jgi:glutathione S-transferase
VIKNHKPITRFALRGMGQPGPRPVSAPLADPSAIAAVEHTDAMDAAMRHVVHALLVGVEGKQVGQQALQVRGTAAVLAPVRAR